ncbi:MAG: hypothetical protein EOP00_17420 [Pedobacter sp.]|nr:MAG: hypothetical protein EOP00_17420 [Pedobacter sp.]
MKKAQALIKRFLSVFYRKRFNYTPLTTDEYLARFGIIKEGENYKVNDPNKLDKAYTKAWDNRNYEIDKFWTRAAYFWGFIVLIFGGYITVLTSEHNKVALDFRLDLYLVALGLIFSIAWYLVILGSKSWQQNWEGHIDNLENFVSGPIYKTVYYAGDRFYSVSKINELMSILVSLVWLSLFIQYYSSNFQFISSLKNLDIPASLTLVVTIFFSNAMRFGYALGYYKSEKHKFLDRWD